MRISWNWLSEFIAIDSTVEETLDKITMIGLEVEDVVYSEDRYRNFVIGHIVSATKHIKSSRLNVCQVDTKDCIRQIICGGDNIRSNMNVVVAMPSAIVPQSNQIIQSVDILGVQSNGMICSSSELMIESRLDKEGDILDLEDKYNIGETFAKAYFNNDVIFSLSITPNRGDCASIYGLAKDMAAAGIGKLKPLNIESLSSNYESKIGITNKASNAFGMIEIKDIKASMTPQSLLYKLMISETGTYNAVVDILNIVMLEIGLPMHAYDADKLHGNITIDYAKAGESFLDLNHTQYILDEDTIVIRDDKVIIACGGIKGGSAAMIKDNTKNIVIECGHFDPISIAKTGRKLDIISGARWRNERGTDQELIETSILFATQMIIKNLNGAPSNIKIDIRKPHTPVHIRYNIDHFAKNIGLKLDTDTIKKILQDARCDVTEEKNDLIIIPPSSRHDLLMPEDITEEILRLIGYSNIPEQKISLQHTKQLSHGISKASQSFNIKRMLVSRGYYEIVSSMMVKTDSTNTENHKPITIANPLNENGSIMRTSLMPKLLELLQWNIRRCHQSISLFEIGNIFSLDNPMPKTQNIFGVRYGQMCKDDHFHETRDFDIFDVKSDILEIISSMYHLDNISINALIDQKEKHYAHPYNSFSITYQGIDIGYFGEIHPKLLKEYDIQKKVQFFESFLIDPTQERCIYNDKQSMPINKDMSFIIESHQHIGHIVQDIRDISNNIVDIEIRDICTNTDIGIPANARAILFRIHIWPEQSISASDINKIMININDVLLKKYNAQLRGELISQI